MALTPKERAQRWRDRQRELREEEEQKKRLEVQLAFSAPFFEFLADDGNWPTAEVALGLAGLQAPVFEDDSGPDKYADPHVIADVEDPFPGLQRSIERADLIIDCFLDAASELAGIVNRYKLREIKARIAEIEASDLSDATDRKAALANMVRLTKMVDRLNKPVNRTFPQWDATAY